MTQANQAPANQAPATGIPSQAQQQAAAGNCNPTKQKPAIFILGAIALAIIVSYFSLKGNSSSHNGTTPESTVQERPFHEKDTLIFLGSEEHLLKKGEVVRVNRKEGIRNQTIDCMAGGKKYYYQTLNHEKILVGGNDPVDPTFDNAPYFDIWQEGEDSIRVVCAFYENRKIKIFY